MNSNRASRSVTLGEVVDFLVGFPFESEHYVTATEHSVRLLRGDNIAQGRIRWDGEKRWPESRLEGLGTYRLEPGDVVLAMDRPWIEAGLKYAWVRDSDLPCMLVQRVARLRGRKELDTAFLRYLIGSRSFTEHVLAVQTGTAVPHISGGQIRDFRFDLPLLDQQRAIAHILGTLDDKIELNRRTNETLEAMARAIFKSWFVDFDPVKAKAAGRHPAGMDAETARLFPNKLQACELGEIPEGWDVGKVSDLCDAIFSGGTPSTLNPEYWDGDIPWLSSGETRQAFIVDTERRITPAGVSNSSTRLAPASSTVIASAGQGNTRGQTSLLSFESYVNQSVVVLTANAHTSSPYHLFFDLERRYEEFRRVSDAHSSRGSLTTKLLAGLDAVLPPSELIRQFDALVGPVVAQAIGNLCVSRTLAAVRDALLPKLMSGNVQLHELGRR